MSCHVVACRESVWHLVRGLQIHPGLDLGGPHRTGDVPVLGTDEDRPRQLQRNLWELKVRKPELSGSACAAPV